MACEEVFKQKKIIDIFFTIYKEHIHTHNDEGWYILCRICERDSLTFNLAELQFPYRSEQQLS